jgi:hypothetical protein
MILLKETRMFVPAIVCLALTQVAPPGPPAEPAAPASKPVTMSSLPTEWHGEWRGTLHIAERNIEIPMGLDILPIDGRDAWTWRMTYGEQPPREYTLVPTERANRFIIDENNGILLDVRRDERTMTSVFAVGEILIVSRYELVGDTLINEIVTVATGSPRVSEAPGAQRGAPAEKVESHMVTGHQRAVLRRR